VPEYEHPIQPLKAEFANLAIGKHRVRSFADIGACWGVHCGYSVDVLDNHPIDKAYVADEFVSQRSRERAEAYPQLTFIQGLFNQRDYIDEFPEIDACIMFDILLHQVDLDWDDFLSAWAQKTRVLIIYNQMWTGDDETIRFVDRGLDWYKEHVVVGNESAIDTWFDESDTVDPRTGRKRRDDHVIWQWGITRDDLIRHVESLGFRLDYFQDYGLFTAKKPSIVNQGFVFVKL